MLTGTLSTGPAAGRQEVSPSAAANQGLVLNKTNGLAIAEHYGDDTDGWHGRRVVLYATTTSFGGRMDTPCVRVKVPGVEPANGIAADVPF